MRILYSLPHPADRLGTYQAGHVIRATALLKALKESGHEIFMVEAATMQSAKASVGIYRKLIKRILPRSFAMQIRDYARIRHGKKHAERLIEAIQDFQPDVLLETHIAFSLAGKIASECTGVPLIVDDCAPAWEEEQQYGVGLPKKALQIHREVANQAHLLIAVNTTLHQYLVEEGQQPEKVITIENGFDATLFNNRIDGSLRRRQYNLQEDSIVIVFVGSFQAYHRVDLLLRAFHKIYNKCPNTYLLLVGAGEKLPESKRTAADLHLMERVIFAGSVPYESVASYLAAGDIAVMPATNNYGNPMKVYEYMALGKAVTAPGQPTITEIAKHGESAYLFEPENIESMADALSTLIENPILREKLGQNAHLLASNHTWEKRAEALQSALMRLRSLGSQKPDKVGRWHSGAES